jgi:hypothetical protein
MRTLQQSLFFVTVILLTAVLPAQSRDLYPDDITVEVVADHRGSLREYPAHKNSKWQRTYIEARKDERYRIRVRNNTDRRIGIVIAVDGRNIISGKRSNLKHNEAMYVLNPWQTTEYSGWRTSRNQEHRFYFTSVGDSYADAWGDRSAMGVIAVAAFPEKWREPRPEFDRPFGRSGPMGSMKRGQHKAPGTGFGEGNWSPSHEVNFVAKHRPFMKKFIKYEWRKSLCRRGIIECQRHRRDERPRNRFWQEEKDCDRSFAPFPPSVNHLLKQLLPVPW